MAGRCWAGACSPARSPQRERETLRDRSVGAGEWFPADVAMCGPCAPFHPISDPPRSGEKCGGRWLLGHPPDLAVQAAGDSSMVGKRARPAEAYDRGARDPRATVQARVPAPQPPGMAHASPAARLRRGHPERAPKRPTREPSAGWAGRHDRSEGDGRGTDVTLGGRCSREGGMADGARALWPRRCRRRRGRHDRPGRAGEPATGRRATGGRPERREGGGRPVADLRACASTGARCAWTPARTVRGGADGTGLATGSRRPPTPLGASAAISWHS